MIYKAETEIVLGESLENKSMKIVERLYQKIQRKIKMNFLKCYHDELNIICRKLSIIMWKISWNGERSDFKILIIAFIQTIF
jgi:hypothetical protein